MRIILCFLMAMTATVIYSCIFCSAIECDEIPPYGHFMLVDATSGQDLVFGPARLYDHHQIKFYALSAADTTFFEYRVTESWGAGNDSVMRVLFSPSHELAFMQLSNSDIDTLHISYRSSESRCCGTSTFITNFRYNNSSDIPADSGLQILMK